MDDLDVLDHFDFSLDETAFQEAISDAHSLLLGNESACRNDLDEVLTPSGINPVNQDILCVGVNEVNYGSAVTGNGIYFPEGHATGTGSSPGEELDSFIDISPTNTSAEPASSRLSTSSGSDDPDYDQLLEQIQDSRGVSMNRKEKWALKQLRDWWQKSKDYDKVSAETFLRESSREELDLALSSFVTEVRMKKDRKYQTETLRQMLMAIQRYMRRCGRYVSFLSDPKFILLQGTLALENVGQLEQLGIPGPPLSPIISTEMENTLWEKKLIGNHNPQTLLDSQFLLFGLYFGIWSGQQHRSLKCQKIKLLKDSNGREFLRYKIEGGRKGSRPKIKNRHSTDHVDVYGNWEDPNRNIVELYKQYNRRCPSDRPDDAYYMQPISNPTDECWFLSQPVGKNSLGRAMARLAKTAGFSETLDNTSLKLTCAVRLVKDGSDVTMVKYLTGLGVDDLKPYVSKDLLAKAQQAQDVEMGNSDGFTEAGGHLLGTKREAGKLEGCTIPAKNFKGETTSEIALPLNHGTLRDLLPDKLVVTSVVDTVYMDSLQGQGSVVASSYRGFIPDLLYHLAQQLGFQYEIRTSQDGTYAPLLDNGEWGGMVADVRSGNAHVACGPLTIMASREDHVDFTHPFMSMGLSIIYKRPAPGEQIPFTDLQSLIESGIPFGLIQDCAFHIILKRSSRPLHRKMVNLMEIWGEKVYVRSLMEALEKVRNGGFAFLGDLTCADLFPDDVVAIGPRYMSQMFYAFATHKGSPLCRVLSRAIMEMAEQGLIEELYDKWCKHRG